MNKEQKKVIPFKYYARFILISVLITIIIGIVIYVNFKKDQKYEFPFVKINQNNQEVVRIYPASSFDFVVIDDNTFTYHAAKDMIGKSVSYSDLSLYNFGEIDYFVQKGIYKVYDIYDVNYMTLYQRDGKIVGVTYKYMQNKSATSEFPEREYIHQDIIRIQKIIGDNFITQENNGYKNFIVDTKGYYHVLSIFANDTTSDSLSVIANNNDKISINISAFNNQESYNSFKEYVSQ